MKANTQFKNILVFNPAYLGDTIITTPLIRAIHVLYPKARISFCVRPEHADLFYNIPFIDEVIVFDKRNTQKGFSGLLKFVKIISNYQFDLLILQYQHLIKRLLVLLREVYGLQKDTL